MGVQLNARGKPLVVGAASAVTMNDNTENPDSESFGQRLKRLTKAAGIKNSADLAKLLWGATTDARGYLVGRNRDTLYRWESDKSMPNRANLERLAAALGCTVDDLDPTQIRQRPELVRAPTAPANKLESLPDGRYRVVVHGSYDLPLQDAMELFQTMDAWWAKAQVKRTA